MERIPDVGPIRCYTHAEFAVFVERAGLKPLLEYVNDFMFWVNATAGKVLYVVDAVNVCHGGIIA